MNIEDSIEILKNSKNLYLKEKIDSDILEEAIETLLSAYEQKCNYIKENEIYKKNLFDNYEEKCKELEKEKEKNKELIKQHAIEITDVGGNSIKIDLDGKIHNVYKVEEE